MTGFNVDEQQCITVPSGWGWNDKAGSRWRAGDFESPPPKSRLLASIPNDCRSIWVDGGVWDECFDLGDNTKRGCDFDFELNWRKS